MAKYLISLEPEETESSTAREMIEEVLEHTPETWIKYRGVKNGLWDIIKMEFEELKEAKARGNHEEFTTALAHLAAATEHALSEMTC